MRFPRVVGCFSRIKKLLGRTEARTCTKGRTVSRYEPNSLRHLPRRSSKNYCDLQFANSKENYKENYSIDIFFKLRFSFTPKYLGSWCINMLKVPCPCHLLVDPCLLVG